MKLTEHFDMSEFTVSQTADRLGIDNSVPQEFMQNLWRLAQTMEDVRRLLGNKPITITSGYRCPELNDSVPGSAKKSAHTQALACDFICPAFGTPYQIVEVLASALRDYDQLIYEGTWVHLGLADGTPRRQILTAKFPGPKYLQGLVA